MEISTENTLTQMEIASIIQNYGVYVAIRSVITIVVLTMNLKVRRSRITLESGDKWNGEVKMSNYDYIKELQAKLILQGEGADYPIEKHLSDMDLIADLTELKMKYK